MTTLEVLDDLSDALAAAEAGAHTDTELAYALGDALAGCESLVRVDPGQLLADLLADPRGWPAQSWENYFGNASITVVQRERIRVDVLYWLQNASTLHKHVSGGAFMALSGRRLHLQYDFDSADPLGEGVTHGLLTPTSRTMMRDAATSPILPTLTHELYWIEKPSVTVSVRIAAEGDASTTHHRPHEFIGPGAAYLPAAFQSTSNLERWIDGLALLRRANHRLYLQTLGQAMAVVDEIHLIHVLDELCDNRPDEVEALLSEADGLRDDDAVARLAPSVPEFRRRKILGRVVADSTEARLLAGLLWSAAEGGELAALLKAEGVDDPDAFVREYGERLQLRDPRVEEYVERARTSLR